MHSLPGLRRRAARRGAPLLLGLALACTRPPDTLRDPFEGRVPSRFQIAILQQGGQTTAALPDPVCAVPGLPPTLPERVAEVGLRATASRGALLEQEVRTDASGTAAFIDLPEGYHVVWLQTQDGLLQGRWALAVSARVTWLAGQVVPDAQDVDGDGDRHEWLLWIELSRDGDADGRPDPGSAERWVFGTDGGMAWRGHGPGLTERLRLDAQFEIVELLLLPDSDGDFVADSEDADRDGDGVANSDEGESLSCPGTHHAQFATPGSRHTDLACTRCHAATPAPPLACDDCHTPAGRDWAGQPATGTSPHFERRCEQCHAADRPWDQVPGATGPTHERYPLVGRHLAADCFGCHPTGNLRDLPVDCAGCHRPATPPGHATDRCEACHTAAGWRPPLTSHEQFPLLGGHANLACEACHTGQSYAGLSAACASCHQDEAPAKHDQPGFAGVACDACHGLVDWADYSFAHDAWLLDGKHLAVRCGDCHDVNPTGYTGNQPYCAFCHDTAPGFPDHATYGDDCVWCHTTAGWVPATRGNIAHDLWPLEGSHSTAPCASCHVDGTLLNPPRECSVCHADDRPALHQGTFDGACEQCHRATTWPDRIEPYAHTERFVLDGAHALARCADCHPSSYQVSSACIACHLDDRPANHYGDSCADCHGTPNWNPTGSMNHHVADPTALPLVGRHANLLCSDCHVSGIGPLGRGCESCHAGDRPAGHALSGCEACHTPLSWLEASQPPANAFHPLSGRHVGVGCSDCHGPWLGAAFETARPPTACETCHSLPSGHLGVQDPACEACHDVGGWVPALGHTGALPTAPFAYGSWSGRWFPAPPSPHHGASECSKCHTRVAQQDLAFFSCTTTCHRSASSLNAKHNNGRDEGTEAKKRFHLYHFDPTAAHTPADEGGGPWATAHVGCVNLNCHPSGRAP